MRGLPLLTALLLAAALPAAARADAALDAARAKWRTAKLTSYEYGYHKFCECHRDSPPETVVTVRDGKVVGVRHRPVGFTTEVPAAEKNFEYYWTVDGLFELIASALDRHVEVRAQYDATTGYPTQIYIDYDKNLIGDELDVRLTGVTPLAR
ncbi:MAG TPA: DUF6174 domain-containing protein [Gammaproteobacteria bacterium]|nr:DUF6174 domain-containing protein [Gammaproteobacteria bacterium]